MAGVNHSVQMKTYYYIAYSKPRGRKLVNLGDGIMDGNSAKEVRNLIANIRGIAAKNIIVRPYSP